MRQSAAARPHSGGHVRAGQGAGSGGKRQSVKGNSQATHRHGQGAERGRAAVVIRSVAGRGAGPKDWSDREKGTEAGVNQGTAAQPLGRFDTCRLPHNGITGQRRRRRKQNYKGRNPVLSTPDVRSHPCMSELLLCCHEIAMMFALISLPEMPCAAPIRFVATGLVCNP